METKIEDCQLVVVLVDHDREVLSARVRLTDGVVTISRFLPGGGTGAPEPTDGIAAATVDALRRLLRDGA